MLWIYVCQQSRSLHCKNIFKLEAQVWLGLGHKSVKKKIIIFWYVPYRGHGSEFERIEGTPNFRKKINRKCIRVLGQKCTDIQNVLTCQEFPRIWWWKLYPDVSYFDWSRSKRYHTIVIRITPSQKCQRQLQSYYNQWHSLQLKLERPTSER